MESDTVYPRKTIPETDMQQQKQERQERLQAEAEVARQHRLRIPGISEA